MNFQQQSPNSRQRSTAPKTPTTPDTFHSSLEYKPRLFDEIAIIMQAFGDALHGQISASVILVEKIVIQQLRGILQEVTSLAYKRSGNSIIPSQQDFEFLMRKNPAKVQRFRKYMNSVSAMKTEQKQGYGGINFLNRLAEDTSEDEPEIYDPERTRRLFRADRISQILNPQKYEDFQKARSWSSNIRNKSDMLRKLVEILQIPKEMQEIPMCLEIMLFLTQETIATIVDFAILTRLNTDNHCTEPFVVTSSITNNMLYLCPEVTQGRGLDGVKAITVQEINEALRRVQTMSTRRMGTSYRSCDMKIPFLAL